MTGDLDALVLAAGDRPVRSHVALVSTEAAALAWAREGASHGAVVLAGYQASPRGRAGLVWSPDPQRSLLCSVVLRPGWPAEHEGWTYVAVAEALASGLADAGHPQPWHRWPDEVTPAGDGGAPALARFGVVSEVTPRGVGWVVVNVWLDAPPAGPAPAPALLATVLPALDAVRSPAPGEATREHEVTSAATNAAEDPDAVRAAYRRRCRTLGRRVRARMLPMGTSGPVVEGRAADVGRDGSLVVEGADGRRLALRPQSLGTLEELDSEAGDEGSDPGTAGPRGPGPG